MEAVVKTDDKVFIFMIQKGPQVEFRTGCHYQNIRRDFVAAIQVKLMNVKRFPLVVRCKLRQLRPAGELFKRCLQAQGWISDLNHNITVRM